MNIITIIFYILILCILVYAFFIKSQKKEILYNGPIDVKLTDLNEFIRREFLFQLVSWFNSEITVKDMSAVNHTSVIVSDLKDQEVLKKKMGAITSTIVGNMSSTLLSEFHLVYKTGNNREIPNIYNYVSRQVMFYIRKVNVDISTLFTDNKDTATDDLLKMYTLSLENEIYKNNKIETITSEPVSDKQEVKEND